MEIYVAVAGEHMSVERWKQDLSSVHLPCWEHGKILKDESGAIYQRRLLVAPISIYKIATNKENLDATLNVLGGSDYIQNRYGILNKFAKMFRKLLGLKRVPKAKNPNPIYQANQINKAVAVVPIGIKEDGYDAEGIELI